MILHQGVLADRRAMALDRHWSLELNLHTNVLELGTKAFLGVLVGVESVEAAPELGAQLSLSATGNYIFMIDLI